MVGDSLKVLEALCSGDNRKGFRVAREWKAKSDPKGLGCSEIKIDGEE